MNDLDVLMSQRKSHFGKELVLFTVKKMLINDESGDKWFLPLHIFGTSPHHYNQEDFAVKKKKK